MLSFFKDTYKFLVGCNLPRTLTAATRAGLLCLMTLLVISQSHFVVMQTDSDLGPSALFAAKCVITLGHFLVILSIFYAYKSKTRTFDAYVKTTLMMAAVLIVAFENIANMMMTGQLLEMKFDLALVTVVLEFFTFGATFYHFQH